MHKVLSFGPDTVHYDISGTGKPLVLLHGFLEDATIWNTIQTALCKSHLVLLIDLPGHGKSTKYGSNQSMEGMANLVWMICRKEEIERPIVFGHSMGGYVGLELAKLFKIEIVLVHSNFWEDSTEKKKDRNRVIKVVQSNLPLFVSTAIPNLFFRDNKDRCNSQIKNLVAKSLEMESNAIVAATQGMRDRIDNAAILEENTVAIIQGKNDPIFTQKMMLEALEPIPSMPLYIELDNCGHMGFAEQPEAFFEAILQIIDKFSTRNSIN